MKKIAISLLYLILTNEIKSQIISIGQNAEQVKFFIEWETKDHYRIDTYGHQATSIWTSNVKYNNGKIIEVMQCCQNQYMYDLRANANYCKHFVMSNNKLQYILTQFENVSKEKLIENFNKNSTYLKISDLYFSSDCESYSKIYLASNGLATIKFQKTVISEQPINIQKEINFRISTLKAQENRARQGEESHLLQTTQEEEAKKYESQLNDYYAKLKMIDTIRMYSKRASGNTNINDSSGFYILESNIHILPSGKIVNGSILDLIMNLNIRKDFYITRVDYIYYKSNLIAFIELEDGEGGYTTIRSLNLITRKTNWDLDDYTFK